MYMNYDEICMFGNIPLMNHGVTLLSPFQGSCRQLFRFVDTNLSPFVQDLVRFVLRGEILEVSINGTFGKTLQVLRVDGDHSGRVSDQDD